jgi:ribosomal protein L20
MARVKRGVAAKKRHKKVLKQAKGYYGNKSRSFRAANEQVMRSRAATPSATGAPARASCAGCGSSGSTPAARLHDMSYSRFIAGLNAAGIEVDRKILVRSRRSPTRRRSAQARRGQAKGGALNRPDDASATTPGEPLSFQNARDPASCGASSGRRSARHDERGRFAVEGPVLVRRGRRCGLARSRPQFVARGAPRPPSSGAGPVADAWPTGCSSGWRRPSRREAPIAVGADAGCRRRRDLADGGVRASCSTGWPTRATSARCCGRRRRRGSEARGAHGRISVDPFNPKVVRASAGALFHVPVLSASIEEVVAAGLELLGTTSHGFVGRTVVPYTEADLTGRVAIVMGNEAAGLPDDWNDTAGPVRSWITIPHAGRSESLNVAMATTVLVFEAARQRSR